MDEVTPQDARTVRFREKLRGYHPEDVDAFVARVVDTLESLQARLRDANARAEEAERRAHDLAETEDSVRRTLVLAQKTADEAIREAQEESARLVADAEARRGEVLDEVERLREEMAGQAHAEIQNELERLADVRQRLEEEARALHAHIAEERSKLRALLENQLHALEEDRWRPAVTEREAGADSGAEPSQDDLPASAPGERAEVVGTAEAAADVEETGAAQEIPEEEDSFLAELRRAADDDTPLGPRDDEPEGSDDDRGFFDDDGGRFGSPFRRRR